MTSHLRNASRSGEVELQHLVSQLHPAGNGRAIPGERALVDDTEAAHVEHERRRIVPDLGHRYVPRLLGRYVDRTAEGRPVPALDGEIDLEEMVEISRHKQIETCACDSVGICQMAEPTLEVMAQLVGSFYGWNWTVDDIIALGKTVLKEEVAFNRNAGLGPETDRLPDFLRDEKLGTHKGVFDIAKADIEKVLELD